MQTSGQRHKTKSIVFWLPCQSKDVLCVSISLSEMERNGTEQNRLELKNRLLNFHATLITNNLLNQWLSMTKMKPLHVEFCLETQNKKHRIFGFLADPKMSSVFLYHYLQPSGTERNCNDQLFTQRHCMQTSAQRHRTKSIVFWLSCQSKDVLCVSISLSEMERNGTRLNGTERILPLLYLY